MSQDVSVASRNAKGTTVKKTLYALWGFIALLAATVSNIDFAFTLSLILMQGDTSPTIQTSRED